MGKRGRPRVDNAPERVRVDVTLSAHVYDALYAAARRCEVSIPELIRQRLRARRAAQERDGEPE